MAEMSRKELVDTFEEYILNVIPRMDFVAERGDGMYVYDMNGKKCLDFYAGIAVNSVGNNNPRVVEAIKEQADLLIHSSNYPYSIPQAKLAKLICDTIGMDKIFFQNSGTEAVEAMIKMARKYGVDTYGPNRYHIVSAKQSFHGRTYGALSATGQPDNGCQLGYHPVLPGFTYADFNDLDSFRNACTEDTIAILVEPVQGEGGVYPATEEFLKGLRELCDEKGMLLLLDEVQTGWGRCGDVMAYQGYGVKPDIVSMAKAMGGGMPIGAVCLNEKVAKVMVAGSHGSTYAGNPVCCAASLAAVSEILEKDLAGKAKTKGTAFMKQLETLPKVKEVRGRGLLLGVEFSEPIAGQVKHDCWDEGLLITAVSDRTIRMLPPLIAEDEHYDAAYTILKKVVEAIG